MEERCKRYKRVLSTCFFNKVGYNQDDCFFSYIENNQEKLEILTRDFCNKNYNVFTGIVKSELKRKEYTSIYDCLNFILETNENIKTISKIYSKILNNEDIKEELKKITINKIGEEIKGQLKKNFRYQSLLEEDKIIILLSVDAIIYSIKNIECLK